jgi:hypothetical protein
METLLRQKDCKSKHNFLITKQLTQENRQKNKEKRGSDLGAKGLGIIRLCNSCFPLYFVPLQSGLDRIGIEFLETKKT